METVTTNTVISTDELQSLRDIQKETQSLVLELGEIELMRIQLDERHATAKVQLTELSKRESEFNNSLYEKYGQINLNPETGEIFPLT
jgi:hypothetical protein